MKCSGNTHWFQIESKACLCGAVKLLPPTAAMDMVASTTVTVPLTAWSAA